MCGRSGRCGKSETEVSVATSQPGFTTVSDRVLDLVGDDPPDARAGKLWAFQTVALMAIVGESLWRLRPTLAHAVDPFHRLFAGLLGVLLVSTLARVRPRITLGLAALALAARCVYMFPETGNHAWLAAFAFLPLAFLDLSRPAEQALALKTLRWMTLIVLFHTGLQKALFGLYTHGQFLAYRFTVDSSFERLFKPLLPEQELERLATVGTAVARTGPFHFQWLPLLLVSNAVVALELTLPLLLLLRRTRRAALVMTALLMLLIESGALELTFLVLFVDFLCLFLRADHSRRLVPAVGALLLFLLVLRYLLAPEAGFA